MKMPRHAALASAALAALATVGYAVHQSLPARSAPSAAALPAASAPQATEARRVAGSGVVEPAGEAIALAPAIGGVVASVRVKSGERVRRGEVLMTFDAEAAIAEQRLREAAEETARRALETAQEDLREKAALLTLYRGLDGSDALVPEERLRRESAWRLSRARAGAAQSSVAEARAASAVAAVRVAQLTLRAPMDAWVLQVRARAGEWVQPGGASPLTLARLGPLQVRVDIDEADVARLEEGREATVVARGDGTPIVARFVRAEPLLTPKRSLSNASDERVDTRVLQLLFELPTDAAGFRVGQQVDAFVAARPASALAPLRQSAAR